MPDAIQFLPADPSDDTVPPRLTYSRPEQHWVSRMLIHVIERISGQRHLETLYRNWAANPHAGENLFAAAIRLLEIEVVTLAGSWDRVPKKGPVLFVANHPFGVIDGLLMGHLCSQVRPDVKIITHSLLCQVPEARDFLLPVDFGGTQKAAQTSALTRRRSVEWIRAGHAVVVFPAGSVSTAQHPLRGAALDAPWHPFTAKLATQPGVTVIPVCFHGQNSRLFQMTCH